MTCPQAARADCKQKLRKHKRARRTCLAATATSLGQRLNGWRCAGTLVPLVFLVAGQGLVTSSSGSPLHFPPCTSHLGLNWAQAPLASISLPLISHRCHVEGSRFSPWCLGTAFALSILCPLLNVSWVLPSAGPLDQIRQVGSLVPGESAHLLGRELVLFSCSSSTGRPSAHSLSMELSLKAPFSTSSPKNGHVPCLKDHSCCSSSHVSWVVPSTWTGGRAAATGPQSMYSFHLLFNNVLVGANWI